MKLSIIYYSKTGNTKSIAEIIAAGAESVENLKVRSMSIDDINEAFVNESCAIIFGSPTYCGTFSWQMKKWFDTSKIKLADKLGAVFATENFIGGGADVAELSMIGHLLVKGMIVYSAGGSKGHPYTHFGAVAIKDGDELLRERAVIFGKRIAEKTLDLFEDNRK